MLNVQGPWGSDTMVTDYNSVDMSESINWPVKWVWWLCMSLVSKCQAVTWLLVFTHDAPVKGRAKHELSHIHVEGCHSQGSYCTCSDAQYFCGVIYCTVVICTYRVVYLVTSDFNINRSESAACQQMIIKMKSIFLKIIIITTYKMEYAWLDFKWFNYDWTEAQEHVRTVQHLMQ